MRELFRRLWYLLRQQRADADLTEEIAFHRAMKARDAEANGASPKDAAIEARRALGSTALAHDRARDMWVPFWMQGIGQDLRLALRTLRATPVITVVAVLSLALGIGANTAIFSLVNSLLLRGLPVRAPERLVLLGDGSVNGDNVWSRAVWEQLQRRQWLFVGTLAYAPTRFNLSAGGRTDYVDGLWVSGSFFDVLGVPPLLGRTLTEADDKPGGGPDGPVAVISYQFWQEHYGGAADAIGRTVSLDRIAFTIAGVTPPGFFGLDVGRRFDIAAPVHDELIVDGNRSWQNPGRDRISTALTIVGRLRPDQSAASTTRALRGVQLQIRNATLPQDIPQAFLDRYLKRPFTLVPAATGHSFLRRRFTKPLLAIMVIVALVLLIASMNVANLLLARGTARQQEMSVRQALGASRWRLVRQLFAESAVLAGAGAASGVLLASWIGRLLVRQLSTAAPAHAGPSITTGRVFLDLSPDTRVLAFTIALTIATALLFGLLPALRSSCLAPMDALKGGRGMTSPTQRRFGGPAGTLVVLQPPPVEIVGVAADSVYGSMRDAPRPTMYLPMAQRDAVWWPFLAAVDLNVRSAGPPPASLIKSVTAAIGRVNPELALTFRPLSDQIGDSLTQERLVALVSGLFAVLALLLAALGLYGIVAYAVIRRRQEIGVRMALGASPGSVVRLVIARVAGLVAIGTIAGAGLSLWAGHFVASLLYGLEPRDPLTLGGATLVLAIAAGFAAWLPARRAAWIDPADVLRCE